MNTEQTIKCTQCKQFKLISEFYPDKRRVRNYGVSSVCKACHKINNKKYYENNRDRIKEQQRERHKLYSEPGKIVVRTILEGNYCVDCKTTDWRVLEFDHVRGEKLGNICQLMYLPDLDKLIEEIKKCDIVCANCHKLRTFERAQSWRFVQVGDLN